MKTWLHRIIAILLTAAALAGCGTIAEESAMQWLDRQPVYTDP